MKRSVNSGMNAGTPHGFAKCATTHGGVVNTTVMIGHLSPEHDPAGKEIKGITEVNHINFVQGGVVVKKHSKMGKGKFLALEKVPMAEKFHYEIFPENEGEPKRRTYKPFKQPGTLEVIKEDESDLLPEEDEENDPTVTFECPNELCDKTFKSNKDRDEHCLSKQCSLTVHEAVSKLWTSQFSVAMFAKLTPQEKKYMPFYLTPLGIVKIFSFIKRLPLEFDPDFCEGFAIKKRKGNKRFTHDQEAFVKNDFDKGEGKKNKKVSPEQVVMRMRRAKDPDNPEAFLFKKSEWLTEQQVKGLFAKFDRLRTESGKKATMGVDVESLSANYDYHEYHDKIATLAAKANEVQPVEEQDHPFEVSLVGSFLVTKYDLFYFFLQVGPHNLCDLVRQYEEATVVQKGETPLMKLPFNDLQLCVKAINKGKRTRSTEDGQKLLINYVKKNCVCPKAF